jgi:hypothetical protein
MRFLGPYFDNDTLANQQDNLFYVHGQPVGEATYTQIYDDFALKPDARWRVYSPDAIEMWLERDLEEAKIGAIDADIAAERQRLLDTFANLLRFNFFTRETYVGEADNNRRYYDGWDAAMGEVLDLCAERLSADEYAALEEGQQQWMESRKLEASRYEFAAARDFAMGRMTQLRVYALISIYCGDGFYD